MAPCFTWPRRLFKYINIHLATVTCGSVCHCALQNVKVEAALVSVHSGAAAFTHRRAHSQSAAAAAAATARAAFIAPWWMVVLAKQAGAWLVPLETTTQTRRLEGVEKQPLRAAGPSRRAAATNLKGQFKKRKKSAFPPRGISTCFGICLSLGPNLEEAKVRGQRRSSRWHRFSIFLRNGEGGSFKAQVNGSLRVSSKCAAFLTTQENVKWHKTAERSGGERRGEERRDRLGWLQERRKGELSLLTSSSFVPPLPGSAAQPCWPSCFLKVTVSLNGHFFVCAKWQLEPQSSKKRKGRWLSSAAAWLHWERICLPLQVCFSVFGTSATLEFVVLVLCGDADVFPLSTHSTQLTEMLVPSARWQCM